MRASLMFALALRSLSRLSSLAANAAMVNRTIDDSDTSAISYVPSTSWRSSSDASCSGCLIPNAQLALQQTFHYGIYTAPPPDADDQALVGTGGGPGNGSGDGDGDDNGHGGSSSGNGGKGDSHNNTSKRRAKWRRVDADDPTFVGVNVTASLTFVGSAFYVYCVLPVQADNATTLAKTNITFLLDNLRVGSFSHNPQTDTGSSAGFQYQVPVFSKVDLPHAQHTLVIKAEVGSIVLLDYVQYSTLESSGSGDTAGGNSSTTGPVTTPSGVIDSQENSDGHSKGNAATFGGAIGGSVGVLTLVALGVFISLFRRRRRSAKRQKFFEAREEAARPASPEMRGPQPFIPRYFPGTTVIPRPPSPPPFSPLPNGGVEELGPSHGLDLPPAPGHAETSESAPLSERSIPIRIPVPIPPPSALLPDDEDDSAPPRYQDVGRFPLVSIPVIAHSPSTLPSPPGLPDSPSSLRSPSDGESPTSLTSLSPRRPDFSPTGITAVLAEEPTIHTHEP